MVLEWFSYECHKTNIVMTKVYQWHTLTWISYCTVISLVLKNYCFIAFSICNYQLVKFSHIFPTGMVLQMLLEQCILGHQQDMSTWTVNEKFQIQHKVIRCIHSCSAKIFWKIKLRKLELKFVQSNQDDSVSNIQHSSRLWFLFLFPH